MPRLARPQRKQKTSLHHWCASGKGSCRRFVVPRWTDHFNIAPFDAPPPSVNYVRIVLRTNCSNPFENTRSHVFVGTLACDHRNRIDRVTCWMFLINVKTTPTTPTTTRDSHEHHRSPQNQQVSCCHVVVKYSNTLPPPPRASKTYTFRGLTTRHFQTFSCLPVPCCAVGWGSGWAFGYLSDSNTSLLLPVPVPVPVCRRRDHRLRLRSTRWNSSRPSQGVTTP